MSGLLKLREELHNKILILRKIEHLLTQDKFERLWSDSDLIDKWAATSCVEGGKHFELLKWMRQHSSKELGELSTRLLRQRAKDLNITNYSRMTKGLLTTAIMNKERVWYDKSS